MSERVLLVDDEKEFLETMSERMQLRGMEVTTAETPETALKAADACPYDAVILDLQMPGMDGLQTLKKLRAKCPELQVILLTGHATVEKGIEAMKLGAMDFLEKPADMDALTEKIKKAQAKKMILVEKKHEKTIQEIIASKAW